MNKEKLSREERFMAKVSPEPNSGCWLWAGAVWGEMSYGAFMRGDGERRTMSAHRLSYELFNGDPTGLLVCHKCDVPLCVNPEHLFLGTHQDNTNDMKRKGRARYKANRKSRLTSIDVMDIRTRRLPGVAFAQLYGVSASMICRIQKGNRCKEP